MTRVLIVGNGAREHALAWKLRTSPSVTQLFVAPGNPGTAAVARNLRASATDVPGIVRLTEEWGIDLTVIGPEAPLALGLADALLTAGRRVVGPTAAAARIESSKAFAKDLMRKAGVPTAKYYVFDEIDAALRHVERAAYPVVIKADGLAAGKGVTVCAGKEEARACVHSLMEDARLGAAGARIVVEEWLEGPEISLLAFVDGKRAVPLPIAQDHKRLGEGDTGPNTGGMGAYAPVPFVSERERAELVATCLQPVVDSLAAMGTPYRGVLFAGIMLTATGPRVLEYNCRFGDPEAQVILPLLDGDLLPWLEATADGRLEGTVPNTVNSAVGVVLASPGYPDNPQSGHPIYGLDDEPEGVLVFHAGTARAPEGRIVTAGGRVLTAVGIAPSVDEAAARAFATPVRFAGMQRRADIAWQVRRGYTLNGLQGSGDTAPEAETGSRLSPGFGPTTDRRSRIVVLASGDGSNLQALIDWCADERRRTEIVCVVSHNHDAGALRRATAAGIPSRTIGIRDRRDSEARAAHEASVLDVLSQAQPDIVVLAGWMLVLSMTFLEACPCPLLNVHPALLPMGDSPLDVPVLRGSHAVRDALTLGLPYTGVSVHWVTAEVDAGPVIAREVVPIRLTDDQESLYGRIKEVEHRLLVGAVEAVLNRPGGIYAPAAHANRTG